MTTETLGQRIRRRRKEMGITVDGLGQQVGAHAQTVNKIEQDLIDQSRYMVPICHLLQIDTSLIPPPKSGRGTRKGPVEENGRGSRNGIAGTSFAPPTIPAAISQLLNFPVYGLLCDDKGAITVTDEPIDRTFRPAPMYNVASAYGVMICDDEMAPAFRTGDTALINPHQVPRPGDEVVLRANEKAGALVIGDLIKVEPTHYVIKQHAKKNSRRLARADYPICHRVIGRYTR